MILEIRREEPASNSTNSRQDSADAPHRKSTMHATRQDQAANGQESTHGAAVGMGLQGPWRKTPPPGTGQYPPNLKQKRSEIVDGLVPKQNEPTVSEADREANPR